ncbi:salt stress protein, Slr1339 family [Roseofilum capinflatum]|uniref:ATPase n=1 Tax=Roseofilum capinflatum BLCC-M114 TaxID=3022440 RepID=A0ABT7BCL0_9CYAN|nr:hypothetical protein [Roseofilum capinflatum]MDJ1176924.1 hypothetical protein [Roseofilum capinflatum BLCC-M114]
MGSIDDFLNDLKAQHQQKQSGERQPPPADPSPKQSQEDEPMDDVLADIKSQFVRGNDTEGEEVGLDELRQRYQQEKNAPSVKSEASESDLDQIRQRYKPEKNAPSAESEASEADLDQIRQRYKPEKNAPSAESEASEADLDQIRQRYEAQKKQVSAPSSGVEPDLEQVRLKAMQMRSQREAAKASAAQTDDVLDNMRDRYIQNRAIERQKREAAEREEKLRRQQRKALTPRAREWLARLDPYSDEGFWFESFAQGYGDRLEAALDYLQALENTSR